MRAGRGFVLAVVLALVAAALGEGYARDTGKPVRVQRDGPVACRPPTYRILIDVGHTAEAPGADSARNDPEFGFNLRLARLITTKLVAEGFAATRLLVSEGRARPSLFRRVHAANDWRADLVLSVHHDAVPDKFLEDWEFEGAPSHFSDRFSGHSLFVSRRNPDFRGSLGLARLIGREMKAQGLIYAGQYALPLMGRHRHELLDRDVGVYRYDQLVVLSRTRSPAVLLEAGSIVNRDEEMAMNSLERQEMVADSVARAIKAFCAGKDGHARDRMP